MRADGEAVRHVGRVLVVDEHLARAPQRQLAASLAHSDELLLKFRCPCHRVGVGGILVETQQLPVGFAGGGAFDECVVEARLGRLQLLLALAQALGVGDKCVH
jgi:hypothetical protein